MHYILSGNNKFFVVVQEVLAMIQERKIPQMVVASSQHFVSKVSDELIKQFTDEFEKHLEEAEAKETEPQNFFTVFHVEEYREEDYYMELWTQTKEMGNDTINVKFKIVPESEVAFIIISENYENLKVAYDALFSYVRERGYRINGYPRETYLFDDHAPYGFFTEIQLPFIN